MFTEALKKELTEHMPSAQFLDAGVASYWLASLCRLFLRVQRHKHGGAILISPETSSQALNVNYEISYPRLKTALIKHAVLQTQKMYFHEKIWIEYESEPGGERIWCRD